MKKIILISIGVVLVLFVLVILMVQDQNEEPRTPLPSGGPLSKGDRVLSIDITTAQNDDFEYALKTAQGAGMQTTSFTLFWDDFELNQGAFEPTKDLRDWLSLVNSTYPAQNIKLSLAVSVIDTNQKRLPKYLQDKPFNDPAVIESFKKFLDYALVKLSNVELTSLAIGNEIDVYLGTNKKLWQQYEDFFTKIAPYARSKRPNLNVGTKVTFEGLTSTAKREAKEINRASDVVMVTYYPLKGDLSVRDPAVIHTDFETLRSLYPDKPIFILEIGYPSSDVLSSSEEKQAQFVREVFKMWDTQISNIKLISFTWLHDLHPASVEQYKTYYGVGLQNFGEYLGTIGLRTYEGKDKSAFQVLKVEAKARGW